MIDCVSCGGSGYYDVTGSPKCGSCKGTGKREEADLSKRVEELEEALKTIEIYAFRGASYHADSAVNGPGGYDVNFAAHEGFRRIEDIAGDVLNKG